MNVTARGYAQLTELLSPDIVVLEGGYSIEGLYPMSMRDYFWPWLD